MNPPGPAPQIDPVSVLAALLAGWVGAEYAQTIGAYAVICLGALLGAGAALGRRPPSARNSSAAAFVAWLVLMALLFTAPAALVVATVGGPQWKWTVAPLAALIAGIGHDWPRVGRWVVELVRDAISRRVGGRPPDPPPPPQQESQP